MANFQDFSIYSRIGKFIGSFTCIANGDAETNIITYLLSADKDFNDRGLQYKKLRWNTQCDACEAVNERGEVLFTAYKRQ